MVHRRDPRWKVFSFSRNFGHQAAVSAGIFYCHGDVVATMDADLQDPPEELRRFLEKWREGHHVVYAIRTKRKEGLLKRVCYTIFYRLLRWLASVEIPVDAGDFCVMDRAVVDVLKAMPERTHCAGASQLVGLSSGGRGLRAFPRHAGAPEYTFSQLVRLAVTGILFFSSVPLKFSAWGGFFLCAVSLLSIPVMVGWALVDFRLFGMRPRDVAGWTSIVSLILLMSGLHLMALGVIGQYLARIFDRSKAARRGLLPMRWDLRSVAHPMLSDGSPAIALCSGLAAEHDPPGARQEGNTTQKGNAMQESYSTIYADLWRRHWWWCVRHELVMRTVEQLLDGDDTPPLWEDTSSTSDVPAV